MSDALRTLAIANRLQDILRDYNRELTVDALGKSLLGFVFSIFTFGFVYCWAWFIGLYVADSLGLRSWQFALSLAGLFLVVATWSAWRRVDPMAGLPPRLSDRQELMLTLISWSATGVNYFNPRHAVAGFAVVLIGGPANVLEALGTWLSRLPGGRSLIEDAASLLSLCHADYPIKKVKEPAAAFLLMRLGLIKVIDSSALALTAKGSAILSKAEGRARKKPAGSPEFDEVEE